MRLETGGLDWMTNFFPFINFEKKMSSTIAVTNEDSNPREVELTADDSAAAQTSSLNSLAQATHKRTMNPETNATCCSKLFFSWLNPLLKLGSTRPLLPEDIPQALAVDESNACHDRFDQLWKDEDLEELRNTPAHKRGVKSICRVARRFVGTFEIFLFLFFFVFLSSKTKSQ